MRTKIIIYEIIKKYENEMIIYEIIKKYENEMIIYEYKNNNVCFSFKWTEILHDDSLGAKNQVLPL